MQQFIELNATAFSKILKKVGQGLCLLHLPGADPK